VISDDAINNIIKKYVRENLSPTEDEQSYVSDKYDNLEEILGQSCFRAGSFARYTAVRPLHDLDVIWITDNSAVMDDPETVLRQLTNQLRSEYEKRGGAKPEITTQTHSVTLLFKDTEDEDGFSIDIVPAIHSLDPALKNEFEEPIFIVPEILKMNHMNRASYYANRQPDMNIGWIYTDPKGYISVAKDLDQDTNGDYRKTAKFVKAWRGGLKRALGDDWKLKSFNAEQVCAEEYGADRNMNTLEAIRSVFSAMPNYIANAPMIEDRAYMQLEEDKYIDEYLADPDKVSEEDKAIILDRIREADHLIGQLPACKNEAEVIATLKRLTEEQEDDAPVVPSTPRQAIYTAPAQPYSRA
jgi:hypothetical protein